LTRARPPALRSKSRRSATATPKTGLTATWAGSGCARPRLACARRDDKDLAALDRILQETEAVIDEEGNVADADNAFHIALVSAAHNAILVRVLNAFYELTLSRRRLYFARLPRAKASHGQHKKIVKAVRERDAARAMKLIHDHIANARSYWRSDLPAQAGKEPAGHPSK